MRKYFLISFICLLPFFSEAQTAYYVSWSSGNDSNDGKSETTAWQTVSKVNDQTLNPGDSVLFKRGDVWDQKEADGIHVTHSGTSENYIVYAAYGTGAKPKFIDRMDVPGWNTSSNWSLQSTNVWRLSNSIFHVNSGSSRVRMWIDGVELACPTPPSTAVTSERRYATIEGYLYVYSETNPASAFTSMQMTNSFYRGIYVTGQSYVKLINLDIASTRTAINISQSNYVIIDSCIVGEDGIYSPITITGNESTGEPATGCKVLRTIIDSKYTILNPTELYGSEDGVSLMAPIDDCEIAYCKISHMQHSGFDFDNYEAPQWAHTNCSVHDNEITCRDIVYGRGFAYNSSENSYGNKIYNNYIHNTPTVNQISGSGLDFYNNIIDSVTKPASRTSYDHSGVGLTLNTYNNGGTAIRNVNIYNNTILNCHDEGIYITTSSYGKKISQVTVTNNILSGNNWGLESNKAYQLSFVNYDPDPPIDSITIKNNLLYKNDETQVIDYGIAGSNTPLTVSGLNAKNGDKNNVISGNIFGDPLLNSSYYPQTGSPAIDAGIDVGESYNGTAPDIGAVETNIAAPTISISGDQTITVDNTTIYATPVWASGHSGTVAWTKTSGPGTTTIGSPTSTSTTVSNLQTGTYVFRCTATQDDGQTTYDEVSVTVNLTTIQQPYIQFRIPTVLKNQ